MAITLTSLITQPFQIASNITIRVRVAGVDYNPIITAQWFRTYLANAAGAGTVTDPVQFIAHVQTKFNAAVAGWTVRLRTDGRMEMTNTAGTWSVTWTAADANGAIVRNLLGWTGDIGSTNASTYAQSQEQPAHCLFSISRKGTAPKWHQQHAVATLENGIAYGFRSGAGFLTADYDFSHLPIDAVARDTIYAAHPTPTPLYATLARRWSLVQNMTTGFVLPYTWQDFLGTCVGQECGAAFGTLQDHLAASTTTYDTVYVGGKALSDFSVDHVEQNYVKTAMLRGVGFRFTGSETRS